MSQGTALLPDEDRAGVVKTVMDNNPDMDETMAGRIVDEATKFVIAASCSAGKNPTPSRIVDEGWHALILHTYLYSSLCTRRGGYVHHTPGYNPRNYDAEILERTKTRTAELGFDVDSELWGPPGSDPVVVAAKCQHTEECAIMPMPPDPGPTE
ncbi:hypothetical protein [Streptomyces rapamycinicus]|uniref:Uncharacterized protein n=2 Tax=Streptomyces rapamycinicus TaxID=1226757 RepID=A0A3L8R4Z2_STRRN|nr:hypothetical protein [Streptomyces rapamycinicus]MBB4780721.1 hypothetical protein [Streptomyces rapamycinicus]RLV74630.1 hypothetical protein D3C57_135430 [Streptomyces rapamycinicus NRRL 5491]UTO61421.1 hypothetical protein LJB45_03120 [Streptomyces rapamycinicus]UTP29368.1 hypothetical protein LIV37_08240 [Streptomyces rapamycinicus NRRL 5491]